MSYVLHEQTEVVVMQDGSGIALFNGLNGRSAFLQNTLFGSSPDSVDREDYAKSIYEILPGFDVKRMLNLSDVHASKSETWLLNNNFISKLSR